MGLTQVCWAIDFGNGGGRSHFDEGGDRLTSHFHHLIGE